MLDLTLTEMQKGRYRASVRVSGDISRGKGSMGGVFDGLEGDREGKIGELVVDGEGRGSLVGEIGWRVWEMVGRGSWWRRLRMQMAGVRRIKGVGLPLV